MGETDHVGADGLGALVAELADQGPVDLDRAQVQAMEVAEAGVAGAEIVQGDGDAELAERVELMVDAGSSSRSTCSVSSSSISAGDAGGLDQVGQAAGDAAAAQLRGREVDGDARQCHRPASGRSGPARRP